MKKSQQFFLLILASVLVFLPQISSEYVTDWLTKTMIFAIFALSLELLVGQTGLVCDKAKLSNCGTKKKNNL
jgi:branched-chain amino acid transport system permease protein